MALGSGTRLGPYEILSPFGAGGMGEVFRARDTRLGRDVAVKVLPDHLASDPRALLRFETEPRAVAALSHPNILALYDVGEINGVRYAVTELLEGETLRALVSRGPVPVRPTLEIVGRVAAALAAAHEKGIVHRDVKPENVFLTHDGQVKLLDFGLARQENAFRDASDSHTPTVSARTEAGAVVGTVAYMSPEQARGLPVDHRSDQFSLGVTLYEMVAGTRPFHGGTGADVLAANLKEEPPALSSRVEGLPAPLATIVERCLSKEPRGRYDSTRDLARDLASFRLLDASGPSAPPGPVSGRMPRGRRRFAAVVAVAIGVAVTGSVFLARARGSAPSGAVARRATNLDPKRVAVAPFENRTGDAALEPLSRLAAEWITEGISGIRVDAVPSADVFDASSLRPAAGGSAPREPVRAMAERTGAGIVVTGAYYLVGNDLRFQAEISEVATAKLLRVLEPATAPRTGPIPAVDALRRQVRDVVGVRLRAHIDGLLEGEGGATRYEAYAEMVLGDEMADDFDVAAAHYRKALELDPGFVMPRFNLASSYRNRGRWEEAAREFEPLRAMRSRLSPYYRSLVDGWEAMLAGRNEKAFEAALVAADEAPGDVVARNDAGLFALIANRPEEALRIFSSPARWELLLVPTRPLGSFHCAFVGRAHHALGQHDAELAAIRKGRSIYKSTVLLLRSEVAALVALGLRGEAESVIADSLGREGGSDVGPILLLEAAAELRGHGATDESRAMAGRAVGRLQQQPHPEDSVERRALLVRALLAAGRWNEAAPLLARLETEQPSEAVVWMGLRAIAAFHAGDGATVARLDSTLARIDRPYLFGKQLFARAGLAAHRGEASRALELFQGALARGYSAEDAGASFFAHRTLELAPLVGNASFTELIRPRG